VYQLAVDAIEVTAEVFLEKKRDMPVPRISSEEYSGRVTLRLPRSLHRAMVEASDDEGISLNQYMVNVLSYFSGYAAGGARGYDHTLWSAIAKTDNHESTRKPNLKVVYSNNLDKQAGDWKKTG
jgi:hypothetical protein